MFDDHGVIQQFASSHDSPVRWLSNLSFSAVQDALGAGPRPQRIINALLHGAVGALLFGFLARLQAAVLPELRSRWLAFFAALWFVVHPVAVYGVAYLAQRSVILATLFSIMALWCVLEGLEQRRAAPYVAAIAVYLLAMLSKEQAVMLPAVALALAALVRGVSLELARRAAAWLAACVAIAAALLYWRWGIVGSAYEPHAVELLARLGAAPELAYPLSVQNQASLFFRYLATWIVPLPQWLSIDVRTTFPRALLAWPETAGFVLWLAYPAVAVWLLLRRGRAGLAGLGLLYPWLLALTEMATVRVQEPFVLYRSYLWMSGLPMVLAALAPALAPRWRIAGLAALCLLLAAGSQERLRTFSGVIGLWDDAIAKNRDARAPYVERAYVARGFAHLDGGRLGAARADFERALQLEPSSADAYVGRGMVALHGGGLQESLDDLDRAIALEPLKAAAYFNRCLVKDTLGRRAEALADCDKATELAPLDLAAWINRGAVYAALARTAEAEASYQRALEINPRSAPAHYNYGVLLHNAGRRDEAREHFMAACRAGFARRTGAATWRGAAAGAATVTRRCLDRFRLFATDSF